MDKSIVFFSAPAFGHNVSVFPVIKKLVDEGNSVDWYCTIKYREFIEKSGANFVEYPGNFEDFYSILNITSDLYNLFDHLLKLNRQSFLDCYEKIKNQNVDLIIYDSMCSFGKNIALKLEKKHICFCTTLAYNSYTFVFSNMFLSTMKLVFKNFFRGILKIREENLFRRENGLKKLNLVDIFVNEGDKTLVFTPKEFQPFYNTFKNSYHFVGTTIKERINLYNEKYENYDLYISFGTINTENEKLLKKIVYGDFLKGKKSIVTVGNLNFEPRENIDFVERTSQLALLDSCGAFINHGGLNSVFESIYKGVAQISIPQQEEQRMNAIILEKKGLGIYLKEYDEKKLKEFDDNMKRFADNLKEYSEIFRKCDGTKNSFEIIVKLME